MKHCSLFFLIATLAAAAFLVAGSARAELLAYFPFDGDTNEVQNNLPVTVNGGGLTYVSDGKFGQAAHFDGIDDYLDVADGPGDILEVLDGASPELWGTIMLWVRTTDTSGSDGVTAPTFVERRQPGSYQSLYKLHLGKTEGIPINQIHPSTQYLKGDDPINDGQWHHVAVTVKRGVGNPDNAYAYIFFDGYQDDVKVLTGGNPSYDFSLCEDLHIGGRETNAGDGTSFVEADIDELAVYDEYLSGAEIREIMVKGVPEPCTATLLGLGLFVVLLRRKR